MFQLLPITEHYPNYSSKDEELKTKDREGWWGTFLELQGLFRELVKLAVENGKMSQERAHVYVQSGKFMAFINYVYSGV